MIFYIIAFVLLYVTLSKTGFEIEEKVEINASVDEVWSALTNLRSYSRWNTQLHFLGGEVKLKGKIRLKLISEGIQPHEFKATISHWEKNRRLAWMAGTKIPGIFRGERFFELEEMSDNLTILTNREEYRGVLSSIVKLSPLIQTAPQAFQLLNTELKDYVES